jgi:hypothetical protein
MKHLTENQLNQYLDGLMEASAQTTLRAHLSNCADCRDRLAALQTVVQALAMLPEELPGNDLTPSILRTLPRGSTGLGWRLAFAAQSGVSIGFLLLLFPYLTDRILAMKPGWNVRFSMPELTFPNPVDFTFSLPPSPLTHPPIPTLPVTITHANLSIWLILGIAAALLFIVGNFSLIFHSTSKAQTRK